ncbi:NAD(P)H-hydrate dehydratase [Eilatimonas milleporae]|uniref:Bifunctional NAD(P)H-hydrate repair enzyme n=1 Tax=Eilatimonas milleporae TaxID=911205 RepID=A0A3M0CGW4_9PROT|nr:NAD(P)H-hydrate dehydratase [Eilatimonas milleporae]RMB08851.1 hydroxyethylthiazole kinase-like uncharacterized protein yjeF/hydroxyethylthiazole kinase-like uncharacterized protein yjeF [Eilatimonas milleporae]
MAVATARIDHILLSPSEMAAADAYAIEHGVGGLELMERAGRGVARIASDYLGDPSSDLDDVVILTGPGNNGGDGYVAARYLATWGYPVRIMSLVDVSSLQGDAAAMARQWDGPVLPADLAVLSAAGMIIDGLFGAGLSRPLEGQAADIVQAANQSDAFRLAIDLPSGLDGATGQPTGPCFHADATVTFFLKKPGHLIAPGRFLCGGTSNIHVADIGTPASALEAIKPVAFANEPALWSGLFPHAGPFSHKYDRGHVLVLGGREPALGASRLSSLAALRSGAGLVTLAAPAETYAVQATALIDVMVRKFEAAFGFLGMLSDPRLSTVVLGPGAGVGERTAKLVEGVISKGRKAVVDADALTSLVDRLDRVRTTNKGLIVMTPHDGEFRRLFPGLPLDRDRLAAAREAAAQTGAYLVLKGVSTIVAAPDGRASVAHNAPAWLSVGGTGDVLSGIIAGLLAQGMPAFEAASAAVWLHGQAAVKAGRGMIASDLLDILPKVLP